MSNTDEGKPAGKSGRRSRKGESKKGESKKTAAKKGQPESPAPVQLQSPDQDNQFQTQPVHTESPKVDEPPPADPMAWRQGGRLPPLLPIGGSRSRKFDVAMWLVVLVVALATAFAVYHFLPPA